MLSEEEKEAIKILLEFRNYYAREDINRENFNNEENYKKALNGIKILKNSFDTVINLITRLQKENDILKNHIHYKKCQNCGKEYRTKRSDSKYCNECAKTVNNKNWYRNLTEEQKRKRREQSKKYMRKIRKEKKDDRRRKESY